MKLESKAMEKNPVIKSVKWIMSLLKNKVIFTLVILIQGIVYILSPEGSATGTVTIGAILLIAAAVINICIHLIPKERGFSDYLLSLLNVGLLVLGVFCLIQTETVEPYVRVVVGVLSMMTHLTNLIEVLRYEKKDWKYTLGLIVSVLMIGIGFAMCVASTEVIEKMQISVGGFLILNAVVNLWYILRLAIRARSVRTEKEIAQS